MALEGLNPCEVSPSPVVWTVGTQQDNNHRDKPFMRKVPEGVLSEQKDLLSGQKMITIFRPSFNKSTARYQMIL